MDKRNKKLYDGGTDVPVPQYECATIADVMKTYPNKGKDKWFLKVPYNEQVF
jgi:hypothetical protein